MAWYSTFELVTPEGSVPILHPEGHNGFVVEIVRCSHGLVVTRDDGTGPWTEVL